MKGIYIHTKPENSLTLVSLTTISTLSYFLITYSIPKGLIFLPHFDYLRCKQNTVHKIQTAVMSKPYSVLYYTNQSNESRFICIEIYTHTYASHCCYNLTPAVRFSDIFCTDVLQQFEGNIKKSMKNCDYACQCHKCCFDRFCGIWYLKKLH